MALIVMYLLLVLRARIACRQASYIYLFVVADCRMIAIEDITDS